MTCENEAASRASIKAKSLQVSVEEGEQVANDGIGSIQKQLDQMRTILKGANFKPNNGFKQQNKDKQDPRTKLKGPGTSSAGPFRRGRLNQCNVTAVMGGGITNNSVLVRNPPREVKSGQT